MLSEKFINRVKIAYGFQDPRFSKLGREYFRYVYKITDPKGKFILRALPQNQDFDQPQRALNILKYLEAHQFPAPRLAQSLKGEDLIPLNGKYSAFLTTYIEGGHPLKSIPTMTKLGTLSARIHNLDQAQPYPFKAVWSIKDERQVLMEKLGEIDTSKLAHRELIPKITHQFLSLPGLEDLPKTLIHTDIHERNTIQTAAGDFVLIDWDDAGRGVTILDLAYVLSQVCITFKSQASLRPIFQRNLAKAFIEGYYQLRSLNKAEIKHLILAMQFCALAYTIHYWVPKIDLQNWARYNFEANEGVNLLRGIV